MVLAGGKAGQKLVRPGHSKVVLSRVSHARRRPKHAANGAVMQGASSKPYRTPTVSGSFKGHPWKMVKRRGSSFGLGRFCFELARAS